MSTLVDSFHSALFQRALVEAVLVGALGGVVGVHVVLRRLPFFVVALSHATFPGVAIAAALGASLFLGGTLAGAALAVALLVVGSTRAIEETSVVGVVLAGAFAVGVLVTSAQPGASRELTSFLVGSILTTRPSDVVASAVVALLVLVILGATHKELVLGSFDRGGAAALGYRPWVLDAVVLGAVTVTLVTAVPVVGTLLAVALLTVPALTARLWAERVGTTMLLAALLGAAAGLVGLCAAAVLDVAAGGAIALTAAAFFVVSLAGTGALRRWLRPASGTSRRDRSPAGRGGGARG